MYIDNLFATDWNFTPLKIDKTEISKVQEEVLHQIEVDSDTGEVIEEPTKKRQRPNLKKH